MKARYDVYEKLRDMMNLTDTDVAKATGINKSTFSDWKSGRSNPGGEKIIRLSIFFGNDYSDYFKEGDIDQMIDDQRIVTSAEYQIIVALRKHPEMYGAVCKLLDVPEKKEANQYFA